MKKIVGNIVFIASIAFFAWLAISYIEVMDKSFTVDPAYSPFNFFCLLSR